MSVRRALYEYLTASGNLPGLPAKPFVAPQVVNGLSCENRNDARRWLRDRVGLAIFDSRVPEGNRQASIEIRSASVEREHDLTGAIDGHREYLTLTSRATGGDASLRVDTIARLLALAVDGYYGDMWGGIYIGECLADTEQSFAVPPADGSDNWTFERRLDVSVLYCATAPMYAEDLLRAVPRPLVTGPDLRLIADVLVPTGRELKTVAWTLRAGNASGAVLYTVSGAPGGIAGGGTILNPVIVRATYSIAGSVWCHVAVTDDAGATATGEVIFNAG